MTPFSPAAQLYVWAASKAYSQVRRCYPLWRWLFNTYQSHYDVLSAWKALAVCQYAQARVPAYQNFLKAHHIVGSRDRLNEYPETSKESYALKYSMAQRCVDGKLWQPEASIDESSGSSGKPYNWVRSATELTDVHYNAANYARLMFGDAQYFTINAFSMGAWSTGINTGRGLAKLGLIKSTGPDIEKILDTIETFGPEYHYLLGGYPPFLKHVFDAAVQRGLDLTHFKFSALVGGESLSEGLRDYLEKFCDKVRSVYGLSDVQIGMAGETDLCVRIRQLLVKNRSFAAQLLGESEDRIPMVFQYNPLEYYLEVNHKRELLATATNLAIMSPKVRYNTGDEVMLLSFEEMCDQLAKVGVAKPRELLAAGDLAPTELPFLVLFGRRNSTVSYMGANIYPQDIENALFHSQYASQIAAFFMTLRENKKLESRPEITLILSQGVELSKTESAELIKTVRQELVEYLLKVSRDYEAAVKEDATATELLLRVLPYEHPEAMASRTGIKQKYVIKG